MRWSCRTLRQRIAAVVYCNLLIKTTAAEAVTVYSIAKIGIRFRGLVSVRTQSACWLCAPSVALVTDILPPPAALHFRIPTMSWLSSWFSTKSNNNRRGQTTTSTQEAAHHDSYGRDQLGTPDADTSTTPAYTYPPQSNGGQYDFVPTVYVLFIRCHPSATPLPAG